MKKGQSTILHSPALRRLRALKMVEMRVMNKSNAEIARAFNVHENTVQRTLSWAERAGIIADAEDRILQELVPEAHKAILKGMKHDENPIEAAKIGLAVFQGAVPGFGKQKTGPKTSSDDVGDDLAAHIALLRSQNEQLDGAVSPHTQLPPSSTAEEGVEEGVDGAIGRPGNDHSGSSARETEVGSASRAIDPEGAS